ncbi:SHOCT domain-containing protein [Sagittula sp.]|uniref:SHOCT domain-containing protein n=1 Tax=Sagittula sp. TaxID=2038081 RepID=UPI003519842D
MSGLTEAGAQLREDLSTQHGVSREAVQTLMEAVLRGGGTQAQFDIPELGGMGQWSWGGMTMVGDMFNNGLKAQVDALCTEIAQVASRTPLFERSAPKAGTQTGGQFQSQGLGRSGGMSMGLGGASGWWPEGLGQPASQGSQNDLSYAIFPDKHRLAINLAGRVTVYDTGNHEIGGISQQQGSSASWTFTSQYGTVDLRSLKEVREDPEDAPAPDEDTTETADRDAPEAAADLDDGSSGDSTWGPAALDDHEPSLVAEASQVPQLPEASRPPEFAPPRPSPTAEEPQAREPAWSAPAAPEPENDPFAQPRPEPEAPSIYSGARVLNSADEIFAALEKLGALRDIHILSDEEFEAKKAELLSRL